MTTFGILGVGSIASSIVIGLSEGVAEPPQIVLAPRNQARFKDPAARLRTGTIAAKNQVVIDQSDVVLLCVLPAQAEEVLAQLTFRENQPVVSVMAAVSLSLLRTLVAPATDVARSIPTPAVATRV